MNHILQSHPRLTSHSEEFWQDLIHWRRKWQPTPVFLPRELHEQYEIAEDMMPKDEPSKSEGVQYVTGEEWKAIINSFRKNEAVGPKRKWSSVVDVSGSKSIVYAVKNNTT